ncbi:hypothetical protein FQZ97_698100 [compost metagenome]
MHVAVEQDRRRHVADDLRGRNGRQVGAPAFADRPMAQQRRDGGQLGGLAQVDEHQRDDRQQGPVDAAQHARVGEQQHAEHRAQAGQQPVAVERDHEADEQHAGQRQQARLHGRGLGLLAQRDGRARHQPPHGHEEPEQHDRHGRAHHGHEAEEALARAVPQVQVLRVADGRERRARVDGQRLQHHQPRQRQVRLHGQHARERHQQEQAHVVGDQRRQQRGRGSECHGQAALGVRVGQQAPRGGLQHAALLDALRDGQQARERAHGLPVDQLQPVHRRARAHEGEHDRDGHEHPQQAVAAAVFGRGGVGACGGHSIRHSGRAARA